MSAETINRALKSIQENRLARSDSDPMAYAKKKSIPELSLLKKPRNDNKSNFDTWFLLISKKKWYTFLCKTEVTPDLEVYKRLKLREPGLK